MNSIQYFASCQLIFIKAPVMSPMSRALHSFIIQLLTHCSDLYVHIRQLIGSWLHQILGCCLWQQPNTWTNKVVLSTVNKFQWKYHQHIHFSFNKMYLKLPFGPQCIHSCLPRPTCDIENSPVECCPIGFHWCYISLATYNLVSIRRLPISGTHICHQANKLLMTMPTMSNSCILKQNIGACLSLSKQ